MSRNVIAAGLLGVAAAALSLPGAAEAQQHWFYGNYGHYDGEAYYPQPRYRAAQPYYYPAYPRPWFWRGNPRNEIVEYQVAPGQWIRVYPDGRQEAIARPRRKNADPNRAARTRQAQPQAQRQAVRDPVPLPKAKPATQVAAVEGLSDLDPVEVVETSREFEATTASLDIPGLDPAPRTRSVDPIETGTITAVTCADAERIVSDFGFSDARATGCTGNTYEIEATRDGKPFAIKVSAADGELTEVKRR